MATSLRVGHGHAYGAVSVLNATATGIGCSLAIDLVTHATWQWNDSGDLRLETQGADDRLGRALLAKIREADNAKAAESPGTTQGGTPAGRAGTGARVTVHSPFPPSRGLKTSSSVAGALVRAAHDALGRDIDSEQTEALAIAASRAAGVTITGALDDQVATTRGGCHVTDNTKGRIVAALRVKPWHVAIWVAAQGLPKSRLEGLDTQAVRDACREAERLARSGHIPEALTANGRAFHRLYRAFGLPVDDAPAEAAIKAGALGAGLSGTGPAVAALFERPVEIPDVRGGTWHWARAVP